MIMMLVMLVDNKRNENMSIMADNIDIFDQKMNVGSLVTMLVLHAQRYGHLAPLFPEP